MATVEWVDGRWVAETCDGAGDRHAATGPDPLAAMGELVEVVRAELDKATGND